MNNREAFEAWAKDHNPDLFVFDTHPSGIYCDDITYGAWLGYQAALASHEHQLSGNSVQLPSNPISDCNKVVRSILENTTNNHIPDGRKMVQSQAQQEPVAWMNPYGGLLHVRETGLEKATFTIPLYLQSQMQKEPDNLSVTVTTEGVWFGKYCFFSHEAITGRTAEQLNAGTAGLTRTKYMEWVRAKLPPAPEGDKK